MILHTGEALIDFIPVEDTSGMTAYRPAPGGSPYNSAIAVARLGAPAAFLGKISEDFFGDQLIGNLERNGVDTTMVARTGSRLSTLAFVKKEPNGAARYAFFAEQAADRDVRSGELPTLPDEIEAIQFGSISLIADPVGETIVELVEREASRRVISFDPNIRTSLVADEKAYRERVMRAVRASTILKVSDEDLSWITGMDDLVAAAQSLCAATGASRGSTAAGSAPAEGGAGPVMVVVTKGDAGSFALGPFGTVDAPAVPTTVSDTIGAGDSFHAAILAWLHHTSRLTVAALAALSREDARAMLTFAGHVAAHVCSKPGADPPRIGELPPEIDPRTK